MTSLFYTGHAYAAFDLIVRVIEGWLADRVPVVAGFNEDVVRERLVQRIADLALYPFVGICAHRLEVGETLVPTPDQALDCGGIILHPATGKATISLRLFASTLLEFAIHWVNLLGAILIGILPRRASDRRPATLVFGVGLESLFYEGSDARFAKYCRAGPIAPLARAQRLIIHCTARKGHVSDSDFAYDRFPLHALIRDTKLGMTGRATLLWEHLAAPWMFLRTTLVSPLLALLARDIAYTLAVRALDRRRMIEAVVITNSVYAHQPLWMRSPATRGFPVHMVWYSQNTRPLVYAWDGFVSDMPICRHIRVDETWVWTKGYKAYLEKLGLTEPVHVVGPILWYLPEAPQPRKDADIRVVMCDVTPVRDDVALRVGFIGNYYSTANMIRFVEETLSVCRELEDRIGRRVRLLLKHKRSYSTSHDTRYIEFIGRLSGPGGCIELIPFRTNVYALFADSDLLIVPPYSSPAYVASHVGTCAIYFDPTKELVPVFEPAPLVEFASGRAELLRIALEAVGSHQESRGLCAEPKLPSAMP